MNVRGRPSDIALENLFTLSGPCYRERGEREGIAMEKWKYLLCEGYFHDFLLQRFLFILSLHNKFVSQCNKALDIHRHHATVAGGNEISTME